MVYFPWIVLMQYLLDITQGAVTVPLGTSHSRKTATKHVGLAKRWILYLVPICTEQALVIQMSPALGGLLICTLTQLHLPSQPPPSVPLSLASDFHPLDMNSAFIPNPLLPFLSFPA